MKTQDMFRYPRPMQGAFFMPDAGDAAGGDGGAADGKEQGQPAQNAEADLKKTGSTITQDEPKQEQTPKSSTITQDEPKEEQKDEAKAKPVDVTKLSFPEGSQIDEPLAKSFQAICDKHGIYEAAAQEIADLYTSRAAEAATKLDEALKAAAKSAADKADAEMEEESAKWLAEAKADAEIGGQKWETVKVRVAAGVKNLGAQKAVKLLDSMGLGDHPEIIRLFVRAGEFNKSDSITGGAGQAPRPKTDREHAHIIYQ